MRDEKQYHWMVYLNHLVLMIFWEYGVDLLDVGLGKCLCVALHVEVDGGLDVELDVGLNVDQLVGQGVGLGVGQGVGKGVWLTVGVGA